MSEERYLIVRGIEINNKNMFLSYSKNFLLQKEIKKPKKFAFIGDFYYTDSALESIERFYEYKEWFDLLKKIDIKNISFYDLLEKTNKKIQKENLAKYLYMELERLEKRIEELEKQKDRLQEELLLLKE